MNTNNQVQKSSTKPTHTLCKKVPAGKKSEFETIGVAWIREDGGFYCKFYGTQIVEGGFYAFLNSDQHQPESDQ